MLKSLVMIAGVALLAPTRPPALPPAYPFKVGETLRYSASLGYLPIGEASLAVTGTARERGAEARCEPESKLQHVVWHHQQSAAVEIDSLTGLVRLFRTIADELAGKAEDGVASAPERSVGIDAARSACRGGTRPG